jgi:hypothetical protein
MSLPETSPALPSTTIMNSTSNKLLFVALEMYYVTL